MEQGYLFELLREYTILESAQIFTILTRYGQIQGNKRRKRLVKAAYTQYHIRCFAHQGIRYYSVRPDVLPTGRYLHQIRCFWVLLDYLDRVEEHYATGMDFPITMRIGEQDYDIAYVEKGSERYYARQMRKGNHRRILLMEDAAMIPMLQDDRVAAFATIDDRKTIEYYTVGGDEVEF